ncbi:hypothetical protein ACKKBG_A10055 [Auxenochlorella protothecoides x Auxenochlorella symbiontica]|uniref:ABC transporter G family member 22 n=3 Tax=Auxenochlorella protothecoides TaxID=3075 RepID=V5NEE2_AUXPR|nr:ABC transporter G family member 22 [Auxenochlorella protothecoides]AHA86565.1 ATP-binding cassette transporter [Auxenochlorella protothecoides]KFM27900.1 ABC transporter G family member 22 [Auxenochlorella protothecoides]
MGIDEDQKAREAGTPRVVPSGTSYGSDGHRNASFLERTHTVKLQIGQTDIGNLSIIESIPPNKRVVVQINAVSAHVPNFFSGPSWTSKLNPATWRKSSAATPVDDRPTMRQILFGIQGRIEPGEVLALMGPSGSGKTSLLSIMGARAQKLMKVSGSVTFNGAPLTKRLKRQVGYVLQDDLLYESLTVEETLGYAAALRLPREMSAADKAKRVDDVITALSLEGCRKTVIGGFFRKGISGGERKRTSVGHELLINPSIMFLDEPTSGLDSTTAMHLLQMLQFLAKGGRVIVTTIHQPSSRIYQTLDNLLLLSQGHCMYHGKAHHAVDWFDALGYTLPYRVNAADFILDLASADVSTEGGRDGEETRKYLVSCSELFMAKHPMEGFDFDTDKEDLHEIREKLDGGSPDVSTSSLDPVDLNGGNGLEKNGQGSIKALHVVAEEGGQGGEDANSNEHRWGASYKDQLKILFQRSIRTRRFQNFSVQDIAQLMVIAVLSGLFWLQKAQDDTLLSARNTIGLLFFEIMFLAFRMLFVALFTFPEEQRMMLKERASGMYRLSAFYFARLMSDWPMDFTIPTLFIIVVYFMGGLRYTAGAFFANYFTVILSMLVAQSLGLLIGTMVMNPKTAQTYATIIMLAMVLTGGFFVVGLADWIGWLKYLSFIYYALGMVLYFEFQGRTIYSCMEQGTDTCVLTNPSDPSTSPECTPVTNLQDSLQLLQDPNSQGEAIRNGFILLGFLIFFRVWCYYALRSKTAGL